MSSEDDLLEAVAEAGRALEGPARHDDVWTRRAAGRATETEARRLASAAEDPYARHMLAATAPRASAVDDALVAAALAARGSMLATRSAAAPPRRSMRAAWARAGAGVAVAALVAAGALLVARRAAVDEVPAYALAVEGYDERVRAEGSGATGGISPGALVRMTATPGRSVAGPLTAEAIARCGSAPRRLLAKPEISAAGVVRLSGTRESLFEEARGSCEVVLVVGRAEAVASGTRAVLAGDAMEDTPGARALVASFRLVEEKR